MAGLVATRAGSVPDTPGAPSSDMGGGAGASGAAARPGTTVRTCHRRPPCRTVPATAPSTTVRTASYAGPSPGTLPTPSTAPVQVREPGTEPGSREVRVMRRAGGGGVAAAAAASCPPTPDAQVAGGGGTAAPMGRVRAGAARAAADQEARVRDAVPGAASRAETTSPGWPGPPAAAARAWVGVRGTRRGGGRAVEGDGGEASSAAPVAKVAATRQASAAAWRRRVDGRGMAEVREERGAGQRLGRGAQGWACVCVCVAGRAPAWPGL